jgi:hypothetical protein
MRRKQQQQRRERYRRLHEEAEAYVSEQFIKPPTPIPWGSLLLALALFIFGAAGLTIGSLILTGYIQAHVSKRRNGPITILILLVRNGRDVVYRFWCWVRCSSFPVSIMFVWRTMPGKAIQAMILTRYQNLTNTHRYRRIHTIILLKHWLLTK